MSDEFLVDADWLHDHLGDGLLIVDTRGRPDYESGHIPGAVNLPSGDLFDAQTPGLDLLPQEEIERRVSTAGIDNSTRLVLYDDSGLVPSARVFWVLENFGRRNMALLNGGFPGWTAGGHPVENGAAEVKPGGFKATEVDSALADRQDVLDAIADGGISIVDTRTPDEYYGRAGVHKRNGHIPTAQNLDWQNHIVDLFNPTFVSMEKLRELYRDIGIDEKSSVITYCRTASRSSHSYFVLRMLGLTRVRNYSGSWTEWNENESLPIE